MPSRTIDVNKIKPGTPVAQRVLAAPGSMNSVSLSRPAAEKPVDYSRVGAITGAAQMNPNWNPQAQQAWQTAHPQPQQPIQPPTNQPVQPPTNQPPSNNISLPSTGSQSQFDTALQAVMKDRMNKSTLPYEQGIDKSVSGLMDVTSNLPETPGWAGLSTTQAERVASLERAGLTNMYQGFSESLKNKQTRQKDLLKTASDAYTDTLKAQADAHKEISKRRQDATNSFLKLREDFAQKGITLSEESGSKFLQLLQTSDNPEQVLNDYLVAASANPAVITAYKKPVKAVKPTSPSPTKPTTPDASNDLSWLD